MTTQEQKESKKILNCGIVMPISDCDDCPSSHWLDVKNIIFEAVDKIDEFQTTKKLVSDASESGVIQKAIVDNLYSMDIVVCDLSGKNPNVMLELGMRLAFDKPTVLIKDDKTESSFDSGIIEYIHYPRTLNYLQIQDFTERLADKISGTYKKAIEDPNYSTFLKNFGDFKVVTIDKKEVNSSEYLLESVNQMRSELADIKNQMKDKYSFNNPHVYEPILQNKLKIIKAFLDDYQIRNFGCYFGDLMQEVEFIREAQEFTKASLIFNSPKEFMRYLEIATSTFIYG